MKRHWMTNTDRSIPTKDDLYYKCEDIAPLIEAARKLIANSPRGCKDVKGADWIQLKQALEEIDK